MPGTAFRLNLMDQQGGVPGREFVENNRWGLAPSLALGLGTPTRAFLSYEHQYEHNLPDYGLPSTAVAGFAPPATSAVPSFYSPVVNPANYYGFVNYAYEHVANDAANVRVEHDFGAGLKLNQPDPLRHDFAPGRGVRRQRLRDGCACGRGGPQPGYLPDEE